MSSPFRSPSSLTGNLQRASIWRERSPASSTQFPQGRTVLEVFRNYQGALKKAGAETLFTCGVQECFSGDTSGATRLYGTGGYDQFWGSNYGMRYLSAKLARREGDVYVSLFVDDKGNGHPGPLYVIEMKPMEGDLITVNAASLANDINRTGHASVYGIYFDTGKADVKPESDATLKEIAKLLRGSPTLKLYVVGHTDNQGALDMNMDLSRRRADAVLAALTTKYGVAATRLRAFGSGPYSPGGVERQRGRPRQEPPRRVGEAVGRSADPHMWVCGSPGQRGQSGNLGSEITN